MPLTGVWLPVPRRACHERRARRDTLAAADPDQMSRRAALTVREVHEWRDRVAERRRLFVGDETSQPGDVDLVRVIVGVCESEYSSRNVGTWCLNCPRRKRSSASSCSKVIAPSTNCLMISLKVAMSSTSSGEGFDVIDHAGHQRTALVCACTEGEAAPASAGPGWWTILLWQRCASTAHSLRLNNAVGTPLSGQVHSVIASEMMRSLMEAVGICYQ